MFCNKNSKLELWNKLLRSKASDRMNGSIEIFCLDQSHIHHGNYSREIFLGCSKLLFFTYLGLRLSYLFIGMKLQNKTNWQKYAGNISKAFVLIVWQAFNVDLSSCISWLKRFTLELFDSLSVNICMWPKSVWRLLQNVV